MFYLPSNPSDHHYHPDTKVLDEVLYVPPPLLLFPSSSNNINVPLIIPIKLVGRKVYTWRTISGYPSNLLSKWGSPTLATTATLLVMAMSMDQGMATSWGRGCGRPRRMTSWWTTWLQMGKGVGAMWPGMPACRGVGRAVDSVGSTTSDQTSSVVPSPLKRKSWSSICTPSLVTGASSINSSWSLFSHLICIH